MQTSTNGNRDLDLFFAMLQDRARDIKMRNSITRNNNLDLIGNLPRDIATNILSRLSIPCIIECNGVCKAWRDLITYDLIKCPEFGNRHRHRHLVVFPHTEAFQRSKPDQISPAPNYKIEKLNDIPMPILHMGLSDSVPLVRSSVNGLILLLRRQWTEQQPQQQHLLLWVCNPITREYVRIPNPSDSGFDLGLPYPPVQRHPLTGFQLAHRAPPFEYGNYNFGFGVSKKSKQYKVVWISQSECRVYTLGTTGQWRSIAVSGLLRYNKWNTECAFLDGNLYWLDPPESQSQSQSQSQTKTKILCFDLETEAFTYISSVPLPRGDLHVDCYRSLCALDDCLCLCDLYGSNGIEIWLMRRGQAQEDWSKKLVINEQEGVGRNDASLYSNLFPIKVLEDDGNGMLLGARSSDAILHYSNHNGMDRIRRLYPSGSFSSSAYEYPRTAVYIPSFLSLKTLLKDGDEDVGSFGFSSIIFYC